MATETQHRSPATHAVARVRPTGLATVASANHTEGLTMSTTTTTTTTTPAERMDVARAALATLAESVANAESARPSVATVQAAAMAVAALRDDDGLSLADIGKAVPLASLALKDDGTPARKADGTPDDGTVSRVVLAAQAARLWADDGMPFALARTFANTTGAGSRLRESVAAAHAVVALGLPAPDGAAVVAACESARDAANAERKRKAAERAARKAERNTPQGRAIAALAALAAVGEADWDALASAGKGNGALLAVVATARTLSARVPMTADGSAVALAVVASEGESDAA